MSAVKIQKTNDSMTHSLTKYLAIFLGLMTFSIILISHNNPSITGAAVFNSVYGTASSFVVLFILLVVIYVYTKLR